MAENCFIFSTTAETKFAITGTKHYVPVVTLSTQGNAKLFKQLRSGFKIKSFNIMLKSIIRFINWSKILRSKENFCFIF